MKTNWKRVTAINAVSRDIKKLIVKDLQRELSEGLTEDEKRQRRRWSEPINKGSWGYVHAWILKLGGYLD